MAFSMFPCSKKRKRLKRKMKRRKTHWTPVDWRFACANVYTSVEQLLLHRDHRKRRDTHNFYLLVKLKYVCERLPYLNRRNSHLFQSLKIEIHTDSPALHAATSNWIKMILNFLRILRCDRFYVKKESRSIEQISRENKTLPESVWPIWNENLFFCFFCFQVEWRIWENYVFINDIFNENLKWKCSFRFN